MKFEVKTHNEDYSKSFAYVFFIFVIISIIIIFSNIAIKFGKISRHYEINYLCKLLIIEKSTLNFKKLSKLTNQSSKQKIWDLCREIAK
tara:strand:+ start:416 stop:682 length:267 start_codon:yes stop_codon:yes gene_type:complete